MTGWGQKLVFAFLGLGFAWFFATAILNVEADFLVGSLEGALNLIATSLKQVAEWLARLLGLA